MLAMPSSICPLLIAQCRYLPCPVGFATSIVLLGNTFHPSLLAEKFDAPKCWFYCGVGMMPPVSQMQLGYLHNVEHAQGGLIPVG